jgi:hypothetical protein
MTRQNWVPDRWEKRKVVHMTIGFTHCKALALASLCFFAVNEARSQQCHFPDWKPSADTANLVRMTRDGSTYFEHTQGPAPNLEFFQVIRRLRPGPVHIKWKMRTDGNHEGFVARLYVNGNRRVKNEPVRKGAGERWVSWHYVVPSPAPDLKISVNAKANGKTWGWLWPISASSC